MARRRRDVEETIAKSSLENLLMQAPALICILRGPEHVFELVNPLFAQLFSRRTLLGKPVRESLPELNSQPYQGILDRVYQTGESFHGKEAKVKIDRREDGAIEQGYFNFSYQPLRSSKGTIEGVLVFAFEVTELVESRRRAEMLAESLHRANREKDDFIAAISHELRTPLTSILGWARMMKLGGLDEKTMEAALDSIDRSTKAQAQLIEDLLDESRIAAGKLRLTLRPVRVEDLIEGAVSNMTPLAEKQDVSVTTTLPPEAMIVSGDPARLQQVVNNLLSNAIKFTPAGGTIAVTLARAGDDAVIKVTDTGRGISAEFLPQVFDRFRQADNASSHRRDGLGLGLSIVHHLVGLHGGSVTAESAGVGSGATFTVRLPLFKATGDVPELSDRDAEERYESLPSLKGVRILVVEDENDNRNVLEAVLLRCGAAIVSATTADDAVEKTRAWKPDVILSDILLPGRDGCQMLEEIRQLGPAEGGQTPAMALSVHGRPNDHERALQAGFTIFRQKPIEPADLAFDLARLAGLLPDHPEAGKLTLGAGGAGEAS